MKAIVYPNNQRAQHVESGIFPMLMLACMVAITTNYPTSSTAWLLKNGTIALSLSVDDDPKAFWTSLATLIESGEAAKYLECTIHGGGDAMKTAPIKSGTEVGKLATFCTHKQGGHCTTFLNFIDLTHINE